jgi:hypothetical protein
MRELPELSPGGVTRIFLAMNTAQIRKGSSGYVCHVRNQHATEESTLHRQGKSLALAYRCTPFLSIRLSYPASLMLLSSHFSGRV